MSPAPPAVTRHTPFEALPELLTVEEIAAHSGLGVRLIYELIKTQRLPGVWFGARRVRVPREVYRTWCLEAVQASTVPPAASRRGQRNRASTAPGAVA